MLKEQLENVRAASPLIHNITNYVTASDCANILLACGGSPIMADEPAEAEEITSICCALNINIGTLNRNTIPAMLGAGKRSNSCGHPVILDPVGAGASVLRTQTAQKLIKEVTLTAIRGNISEIKALACGAANTKGVDADAADAVTNATIDSAIDFAKGLAEKTGAVIAASGAVDIIANADKAYLVHNGHPMMGRITGAGCMLSAMTAAYLAANPDTPLEAVLAAVCAMGLCGEKAVFRLSSHEGNASYRNYLIDEVFCLSGDELERSADYELQ